MAAVTYRQRRGEIETYFDRTAHEAWRRLTSDAPLGRIRRTVRAGRDETRATLLSWLPADLAGRSVLDAGCGTGALALEAARRGAAVTAIDLSANLVALARERADEPSAPGRLDFRVGDMLDASLGRFDHVVAMDSLIHYSAADCVRSLETVAARTDRSIVFTFAPRTPMLALMHAVGRLFPRGDRAPSIQPIAEREMRARLAAAPGFAGWTLGRTHLVRTGFYISRSLELVRR